MHQYFAHLKVITAHKFYVMKSCFRAQIYLQGLTHDNSKFGLVEFFSSAKYFQRISSPISKAKEEVGYSYAWQHHKGKNKHHWEYWLDFTKGETIPIPIPGKYLKEMVCDWIGAGKAYNKGKWTIDTFKEWYENHKWELIIHPSTIFVLDTIVYYSKREEDIYDWLKIINKRGYY